MESFAPYLDIAIKAAKAAGDLLRADFHRPTGPRGDKDKAPVDTEAEQVIRGILLGATSDWGFLGEETGIVPGARKRAPVWVVDPNDGTRDYIKGRRGSSVSVGLVANRRPVLGVVYSFGYPDDDGAVYSAADGREGVWKNGAPVSRPLVARLSELDVVLVSGGGDRAARANLMCTKPARVMSIPSIAHRMALVAAGEAAATTSLYTPNAWDFAAGHCLVLAAGGAVIDQQGNEPVYDDDGDGTSQRLFVGSQGVALELSKRNWDLAFKSERETSMPIARLRRGGAVPNARLVSRAQGAFLGQLVGSALGTLLAGAPPTSRGRITSESILSAAHKRRLVAGQLGSSGEIATVTGRSLVDLAGDTESLRKVYADWAASSPPQPDRAYQAAAESAALSKDASALALARVAPFAIWGHAADTTILASAVRADTAITHAAPIAGDVAVVLAGLLQSLIAGKDTFSAIEDAHALARKSTLSRGVINAVTQSALSPGLDSTSHGDAQAVDAFQFALHQLAHAATFDDAIEATLDAGPSTDAVAAVVGAVMGARYGREGVRWALRRLVLSTRPIEGLVPTPRPAVYWGTDAMALAEALLTAR